MAMPGGQIAAVWEWTEPACWDVTGAESGPYSPCPHRVRAGRAPGFVIVDSEAGGVESGSCRTGRCAGCASWTRWRRWCRIRLASTGASRGRCRSASFSVARAPHPDPLPAGAGTGTPRLVRDLSRKDKVASTRFVVRYYSGIVSPRAFLVVCLLPMLSLPASRRVARAAEGSEDAAVGKITLLNRNAMEEYQNLNFDEAQRLLKEALELATRSGLSQHPIRARTYLNLGIVTLVGLQQRDAAIRYFRKALQIEPEIKLNRTQASPEIRQAFDEAVQGLGSQPADLPAEELLMHDPVRSGVRGQPVTIGVFPNEELALASLVLLYRPAGAAGFTEVKMQRDAGGAFHGVIPAEATGGPDIAYYVVANRPDGRQIAARGSATTPFVVALSGAGSAAAQTVAVAGPQGPGAGERRLAFALMVGTGGGWVGGTAEVTRADVPSSTFAWARLGHVAADVGYWATPQLLVGVGVRLQLVTGSNEYHLPEMPPPVNECGGDGVCSPARGAVAGFARAAWFFRSPEQRFRPYASLAVG